MSGAYAIPTPIRAVMKTVNKYWANNYVGEVVFSVVFELK